MIGVFLDNYGGDIRIPAWYKDGLSKSTGMTSPGDGWVQDEDVLDTWFS